MPLNDPSHRFQLTRNDLFRSPTNPTTGFNSTWICSTIAVAHKRADEWHSPCWAQTPLGFNNEFHPGTESFLEEVGRIKVSNRNSQTRTDLIFCLDVYGMRFPPGTRLREWKQANLIICGEWVFNWAPYRTLIRRRSVTTIICITPNSLLPWLRSFRSQMGEQVESSLRHWSIQKSMDDC